MMTKTTKPVVKMVYAPGCEPAPLTRWERLVDTNPVCHLAWSYNFTGRKIARILLVELRLTGILR